MQIELDAATRQKQILNEKLMDSTASDTEYGMHKDTISKLESNPKLRALVRFMGDSSDTSKSRSITILSDLIEDLTGQDISTLLDKTRAEKTKAALGGNSSAGESNKSDKADANMDYDESVSSLW